MRISFRISLLNHGLSFSRINIIFNLKNVIDKPTRISGNTSTLLDPIILSDTLNCNYSDVLSRVRISFRISLLNHGLSFSRINIVFEGIHAL
jgi:hypothetical protein